MLKTTNWSLIYCVIMILFPEKELKFLCFSHQTASLCGRFNNHRNLQLCFINNSDSDDEEEARSKKVLVRFGLFPAPSLD